MSLPFFVEKEKNNVAVRGLPLSGGRTKSIGRAGWSWSGRTTESSLLLRKSLVWSLAAIHLREEIVVCETLQAAGLMSCELLSNLIPTDRRPGTVRLQCHQASEI
jgi:hypothetical protein